MKSVREMPMVTVEQCIRFRVAAYEIERQRDWLMVALKESKYLIKGREHTGFIDKLIAEIEASK